MKLSVMQTFDDIPMLPKVDVKAAMVSRLGSTVRAAASLLGKPQVLPHDVVASCLQDSRRNLHVSYHQLSNTAHAMLRFRRLDM
jgi:hypothetical protein